ncbi:MAG: PAS domain S-box protein [Crocinitomicaceae bacterium]|nr:PAS domain S-box protein [Crocinitomicaceae bacterium]
MHANYTALEKMTRKQLITELATHKSSQSKYKEVFDSILCVVARVNNDGLIEMLSPSIYELTGYTAKELIGKKAIDFYVDPNEMDHLITLVNDRGHCQNYHLSVLTKTGGVKIVSIDAKFYKDRHGNNLGLESVIRDITLQKKVEETLIANTVLLDESQHMAHLGDWSWDIAEDKMKWSSELFKIFGVNREEFNASYESFLELSHPEDKDRLQKNLQRILEGQINELHFEERILRKNGEVRYLESWSKVIRDDNGKPLKMFGLCLDITDKKKAKKKILESKKQFQVLFENTSDARLICKNDTIVNVNSAFLELYRYESKASIIGQSISSIFVTPVEDDNLKNQISDNHLIPDGWSRANHLRKDGSRFVSEIRSSKIQYAGKPHFQVISNDITERHEMEERIQLTTGLLKESEKIAHLGHFNWFAKTGELIWSDEVYRICGVNIDVVPSIRYSMSLIHSDDLSYVKENLKLAIQRVKEYKLDHRIVRADDCRTVWIQTEIQPDFDANGNLKSLLGIVLDVTEYRNSQATILHIEDEFRSIYENAYSGIPLIDLNGKFIKANQRFIEMLGYSERELLNMTILDITYPDDVEDTKKQLADLISGEISHVEIEKRYIKKTGGEIICHTALAAPIGVTDTPDFLIASLTDITGEKQTQSILRAISEIQSSFIGASGAEKIFRKMLKTLMNLTHSQIGFINEVKEREGKKYLVSRATSAQFDSGISEGTKVVLSDMTFKILTSGEAIISSLDEFEDSSPLRQDLHNLMILPLFNNTQLVGVIGVASYKGCCVGDNLILLQPFLSTCATLITTHKNDLKITAEQLETERLKEAFTNELEMKVAERTEDLQKMQKELSISLEKEKVLGDLKSRFVSTASHQFRTPLTVIQSNMGILSMQLDRMNDDIKPIFEKTNNRIVGQIKRMTTMMNDVLILGKINAGSIIPELELTNIIDSCRDIMVNYNEIQDDKRQLKLTIEGEPFSLNIDSGLFTHAVSNFISNAFKYSLNRPAPEMKLIFDDESIQLFIIDYGLGIPPKDIVNLFEPFYRGSNVSEISGTGLGTSIAKEYVELNNGTIDVNSKINEGTEIILTFKK